MAENEKTGYVKDTIKTEADGVNQNIRRTISALPTV